MTADCPDDTGGLPTTTYKCYLRVVPRPHQSTALVAERSDERSTNHTRRP